MEGLNRARFGYLVADSTMINGAGLAWLGCLVWLAR